MKNIRSSYARKLSKDKVFQFISERFNKCDKLFWEDPFSAFPFFPRYSKRLVEKLV